MSSHTIVQIYPATYPLIRQNAWSPEKWKKITAFVPKPATPPTPPCPTEAFLPQEWDIEKGRF